MESFFRYIAYIDYYEKGLRTHSAGFLRWKMQKNMHQLELEVKDLGTISGCFAIIEEESGKEVASLTLEKGQGSLKESFKAIEKRGRPFMQLHKGELDLYTLKAFRIDLGKEKTLRILLELPLSKEEIFPGQLGTTDSDNVFIQGIEEKYQQKKMEAKDFPIIRAKEPEPLKEEEIPAKRMPLKEEEKKEIPEEQENYLPTGERERKVYAPLQEDKWLQLCNNYPQVHPFGGKKTFLSIKPEDFIILQEKYQKLVHNSFLLHGYYNYQHMILGKLEEGSDKPYYIGVPGVFYEKERQAAGLFGFAGFEGTELPVRNGSYGYYMIEVKI